MSSSTPSKNPPPGQQLNRQDDNVFKLVMKLYETKQYKKALKNVETVLKSNPQHGESLAMKGLILSSLPNSKKEEAYDLVKTGLMKNMKSLICWHVYGLLYRSDNNYMEAIKCYKQALKIEDNNLSILRDLSMLQVHMRDLQSLTDTRQKLLELKPSSKANWLGFAFAHHLQGNHECALAILDSYEGTMGLPETAYDASEFLLYRCLIKFESGAWQETLDLFAKYGNKLVDKEYVYCTSAECHEKLDQWDKALQCYKELVEINPENKEFIEPYVETATRDGKKTPSEVFTELANTYPKSKTVQKLQTDAASGEEFVKLATKMVKHYIIKGIPSLENALKSFYTFPDKVKVIEEILTKMEKEVTASETIEGEPATKVTIFNIWMGLSGHYMRAGDQAKALEHCEKCIKHTPTADSIFTLKARILKRMGKLQEAADSMEEARKMDPADRFYNSKTAMYLLRVDNWKEAEETFNIFTYKPIQDTWPTICEMQCMWYITELGDSLYRLGDVEAALKKYLIIEKTFKDIVEDQFDFHHYVTKKQNIRAYLDLLRFMDTARNHKYFCRAAAKIVRCYLDIHSQGEEKIKERINQKFADKEAAHSKLLSKEQREKQSEFDTTVDYKTPLESAQPFLEELLKYRGTVLASQLLAIEFYSTLGSPLRALRAIKQALTLPGADESVELKSKAEEFFKNETSAELEVAIKEIIIEQKAEVMKAFKC
eukprot:TRINITY_DN763_c14_g1_i1.p1 TRINITY_DN763_c14_g1~~TRINITY_DN763_c14_g1_i1.p1  ORF type:complete len:733 (+),score=231.36 TRINITY_DN763_c14_g1_i1:55-2199(+)